MAINDNLDTIDSDAPGRSSHISGKDWRNIGIAIVILIIIMMPVYRKLMDDRDKHLCAQNAKAIMQAINLYAISNGDQFPPIYEQEFTAYAPRLYDGKPYTWVSLVTSYMGPRATFLCPSAQEIEVVLTEPQSGKVPISTSYGMYGPWSAFPRYSVANPAQSILFAETSNAGALETFDPKPLPTAGGGSVIDGFLIGVNSSNFTPLDDSLEDLKKANFVTRLAFPETSKEVFKAKGKARHDAMIHAITIDGHLRLLNAASARIEKVGKDSSEFTGLWATH